MKKHPDICYEEPRAYLHDSTTFETCLRHGVAEIQQLTKREKQKYLSKNSKQFLKGFECYRRHEEPYEKDISPL